MFSSELVKEHLPKKTIKFKELPNTKECIVYTNYDGFYKYNWSSLKDYLKSIEYKILFILNY